MGILGVPAGEPVAAAHAVPPGTQAFRLQRVRRSVHHEEQLQAARGGACRPEVHSTAGCRIRSEPCPQLLFIIHPDPEKFLRTILP